MSSPSARFTVTHRLSRECGFDHVVRTGSTPAESIADRHFRIYFKRNGQENARLGIMAGKKTLPGAVDRNRIKRIIREAFRQHGIKQCRCDVVVLVKRADSPGEWAANLKILFSRIENRCAES